MEYLALVGMADQLRETLREDARTAWDTIRRLHPEADPLDALPSAVEAILQHHAVSVPEERRAGVVRVVTAAVASLFREFAVRGRAD